MWCDRWLGDVLMFEYHCVGDAFCFGALVVDAVAAIVFVRGAYIVRVGRKNKYQLLLFHFNSFQGGVAQYYSHVHIFRIHFLGDNTLIISTISRLEK